MNDSHASAFDWNPPSDPVEYDKWFREQVQAALDEPGPSIPHEQVVQEMAALIEAYRANESSSPEDADEYDKWFREQVESALADPGLMLPHEQAVEEIRALIEERRNRRTSNQS